MDDIMIWSCYRWSGRLEPFSQEHENDLDVTFDPCLKKASVLPQFIFKLIPRGLTFFHNFARGKVTKSFFQGRHLQDTNLRKPKNRGEWRTMLKVQGWENTPGIMLMIHHSSSLYFNPNVFWFLGICHCWSQPWLKEQDVFVAAATSRETGITPKTPQRLGIAKTWHSTTSCLPRGYSLGLITNHPCSEISFSVTDRHGFPKVSAMFWGGPTMLTLFHKLFSLSQWSREKKLKLCIFLHLNDSYHICWT